MPPSKVTNAERKRLDAALASFNATYASDANWGTDRWYNALYPALLAPTRHAALINAFAPIDALQHALRDAGIAASDIELFALPELASGQAPRIQCLVRRHAATEPHQASGDNTSLAFPAPRAAPHHDPLLRLTTHYNLDAASALAAHILDAHPGHKVLDLCAAPGGKSVALVQALFPPSSGDDRAGSALHLNEYDSARNTRLAANLAAYIPASLFSSGAVRLFRLDGTSSSARQRLPFGNGGYDRVLLDAPCSSERHILHAQARAGRAGQISPELARWRPGGAKALAKVQGALLWEALHAVKVAGRVVYATCALGTVENDGVVERLVAILEREKAKLGWGVRVETGAVAEEQELNQTLDALTERTQFGRIAVPDHLGGGGWGPLFFCVLTKVPAPVASSEA